MEKSISFIFYIYFFELLYVHFYAGEFLSQKEIKEAPRSRGIGYKEIEGLFAARSHIDEIIAILFIFFEMFGIFFLWEENKRGTIFNKRRKLACVSNSIEIPLKNQ